MSGRNGPSDDFWGLLGWAIIMLATAGALALLHAAGVS